MMNPNPIQRMAVPQRFARALFLRAGTVRPSPQGGKAAPRLGPSPYRSSRGFTLVELMVAVGLASLFLTMVATVFTQTQGALSRAKARIHMAQEAEAVFEAMAKDFEATTLVTFFELPPDPPAPSQRREGYFRCVVPDSDGEDPPGPEPDDDLNFSALPTLYFVTNSNESGSKAFVEGAPEPVLVSYRLEWRPLDDSGNFLPGRGAKTMVLLDENGTPQTRGVYRLVRRSLRAYREDEGDGEGYEIRDLRGDFDGTPTPPLPMDQDPANAPAIGTDEDHAYIPVNYNDLDPGRGPLAFHVLWIRYRFLNPQTGEWTDTEDGWSATNRLPRIVEVTLHLTDPLFRETGTYTSRFLLPVR